METKEITSSVAACLMSKYIARNGLRLKRLRYLKEYSSSEYPLEAAYENNMVRNLTIYGKDFYNNGYDLVEIVEDSGYSFSYSYKHLYRHNILPLGQQISELKNINSGLQDRLKELQEKNAILTKTSQLHYDNYIELNRKLHCMLIKHKEEISELENSLALEKKKSQSLFDQFIKADEKWRYSKINHDIEIEQIEKINNKNSNELKEKLGCKHYEIKSIKCPQCAADTRITLLKNMGFGIGKITIGKTMPISLDDKVR